MSVLSMEPKDTLAFSKGSSSPPPSRHLKLTNIHSEPVAFKVKTTAPKVTGGYEDNEEECLDSEACGGEATPPKPEECCICCGIGPPHQPPLLLALSTLGGFVCVMLVQVPVATRLLGFQAQTLYAIALPLYVVTVLSMTYTALVDPGQLPEDHPLLLDDDDDGTDTLPRRDRQCWQYERPVRRYDHYCRWVTNVIGLMNHREFVVMVFGLTAIGFLGIFVDVITMIALLRQGATSVLHSAICAMHLMYSCVLTTVAGPILKIHIGLVSRNEVACEWRMKSHYIVKSCKKGENIGVNELSDDEFNGLYEYFLYDKSKNEFDEGPAWNCWTFWHTPRRCYFQRGDF